MDEKKLNIRQTEFARNTAMGMSGSKAAIKAGYNPSTNESARAIAYKNRNNPDIQEEIEAFRLRHMNKADRAVENLMALSDGAFEASDRVKASELILKYIPASHQKQENSGGKGSKINALIQNFYKD